MQKILPIKASLVFVSINIVISTQFEYKGSLMISRNIDFHVDHLTHLILLNDDTISVAAAGGRMLGREDPVGVPADPAFPFVPHPLVGEASAVAFIVIVIGGIIEAFAPSRSSGDWFH